MTEIEVTEKFYNSYLQRALLSAASCERFRVFHRQITIILTNKQYLKHQNQLREHGGRPQSDYERWARFRHFSHHANPVWTRGLCTRFSWGVTTILI